MSLLSKVIKTASESKHTLLQISTRINIPLLEKQAVDLRASPSLEGWSKSAISGQKQLSRIQEQIDQYKDFEESLHGSNEMLEMARVEKDADLVEVFEELT
jgi:hypothetical protein